MSDTPHPPLVESCEELFLEHGDNYLGQGWTKSQANTDRRRDVMLDLMKGRTGPVTLLDFGCGTGQLLEYMRALHIDDVEYTGLDVSDLFIRVAREKFPDVQFHLGDLLAGELELPMFDYIVMNGLFTYRGPVAFDEMSAHWQRLVTAAMTHARIGVAFNVTSPYVDWERDDLFHVPMQLLADFVAASPCPYFRLRHDYELFETTVHAFREPTPARRTEPS
ncbi:MAG: class I SAM-dependent methyltransferase [Actinomycetota bacterium]|nr:class I SAM-dependent methyltransferase [Actinomycetota bacterium]